MQPVIGIGLVVVCISASAVLLALAYHIIKNTSGDI
jgi:hypothetical protein